MAALLPGLFSVAYSSGYRGRHHSSAAPLSYPQAIKLFLIVYLLSFVIIYLLRMMGVQIDRRDR